MRRRRRSTFNRRKGRKVRRRTSSRKMRGSPGRIGFRL